MILKKAIVSAIAVMAISRAVAWNTEKPVAGNILSDTSRVVDLDEVVIISQPKEVYTLRNQPLSSSMFSLKDIHALGTADLRQLSLFVPSFAMPNYGSRYTSSMYIRGIGSRTGSPAVGIYSDGIPIMSKSALNFHSYETERIDILRGPQGTLYGMNTEGGLVRIYSRNPMTFQGTSIGLGAGTHGYRNIEATHYARPSDAFAFSVGGFYSGQNGFFRNATNGQRADSYNEAGGKLRMVFQPSQKLMVDFVADYQYVIQNGFPYGIMNATTGDTDAPTANRQGNYRRNMFNTGLTLTRSLGHRATFSSTTTYQYLKDYMLMDIDYLPADYMHMEERQHQNAVTQEFALKGLLPLGSSPLAAQWHWTLGAFTSYQWSKTSAPVFFDDAMDAMVSNNIQSAMYNAMVGSMAQRYMSQGMSSEQAMQMAKQIIERAGGVTMAADIATIPGLFHTPQYNLGFFHESNIDLSRRFTVTLGLRYDYSRVKIAYATSAMMTATANVMGTAATTTLTSTLNHSHHDNYNQLLPKLGLTYRLNDAGSNLYATISKGYRAGGFNIQMFSDILQAELSNNSSQRADYDVPHTEQEYENVRQTIAYKPETSWNYEFGSHLNLFGRSLMVDLSAYLMQVKNLQLSVMAGNYGFGRMMVNAGRSRSMGVEVALRGSAVADRLSWAASYGFIHAVFREYNDSISTSGGQSTVSYRGRRVPYVPMHTLSASVDYSFAVAASALKAIVVGANVHAQGTTYWDEANSYRQRLYAVLGAHIDADFGWAKVSLWGRNITNTRYNTFAVESAAAGSSQYFAQRGNPIQLGVDLKLHF